MRKILTLLIVICVAFLLATPANAITEKQLQDSLRVHAAKNIDTMCKQMPDCGGKIELTNRPNGKWIRSYCDLKKDTIKVKVHQVKETGNYVGIIKFIKVTYEATGDSKENVMQQPFRVVEKNRVTKIRQYKSGHWE